MIDHPEYTLFSPPTCPTKWDHLIARGLPNGLGAGSTEYIVCRPISGALLPEYLLAYFKTPAFLREGTRVMSGAVGHQRVPKEYVLNSLIPVAPIGEQRRITDKVESVVARVDACRRWLDRIPPFLADFRRSVLATATSGVLTRDWRETAPVEYRSGDLLETVRASHREFADKGGDASERLKGDTNRRRRYRVPEGVDSSTLATLPHTWVWGSGAELVEAGHEIVYGIVQPGPKLEKGIPYIRGTDIQNGKILVDQLLRTSAEIASRYSRSSLKGGDVLLGIIRSTKVATVPDTLGGANITQGTARFRPSKVIRTKYLAISLESPGTQAWLHERYRGIDMPGLNLADVRRIPIPLPPLEEQDEIVRRVENLFCLTERVLHAYSKARVCVEHLAPSLLERAFRGEVVSQDPKEGHASELLDRIRATRTVENRNGRKKRTERKRTMPEITSESLGQIIRNIPQDQFTFDQMRDHVPGDYDALRDALFELLGDSKPMLRQAFDEINQIMVFKRTRT